MVHFSFGGTKLIDQFGELAGPDGKAKLIGAGSAEVTGDAERVTSASHNAAGTIKPSSGAMVIPFLFVRATHRTRLI
jgi:hypothetical protein